MSRDIVIEFNETLELAKKAQESQFEDANEENHWYLNSKRHRVDGPAVDLPDVNLPEMVSDPLVVDYDEVDQFGGGSNLVTDYEDEFDPKGPDNESLMAELVEMLNAERDSEEPDGEEGLVEFEEEMPEDDVTVFEEEVVEDIDTEDLPGVEEEEDTSSAADQVRMLPGTTMSLADDEEEEKEEEEDVPGTWKDDMDVRDFMRYIEESYANIPSHDGTTILGCERAINYLKNLDREVSKAISLDKRMVLDVGALDGYRVQMMNDMMTLKDHIKKLQRKIREQHGRKTASGTPLKIAGSDEEFVKEATSARPQLVITPFERAVSGMIVNSVVSAGKSFDDVYDVLKKKYAFTDREELAIMQLVSDMGYPIFKDRGSIGKPELEIDFIKSYFA